MGARPIYVERTIRAPIDEIWRRTQEPALHEQWDLRFTRIEYLPRDGGDPVQRFLYETRVGFGLAIRGAGETRGEPGPPQDGRSSVLRFWSEDRKSLIREGGGFWRYLPASSGTRFLTRYDYQTRLGALGRALDRFAFRPLLGWATAWSFDRLALWIEDGVPPRASGRLFFGHAFARLGLAFAWTWQGLVPKLLFTDGERAILVRAGLSPGSASLFVAATGIAEVLLGLACLLLWSGAWPLVATLAMLALLVVAGLVVAPALFTAPFGPPALVLAMTALAVTALATRSPIPLARRCLRRPPVEPA
jgi:hypothetical protein